jgi:hypothetical protein
MSLQLLKITSNNTAAQIKNAIINLQQGSQPCLQSYENYFAGINGGTDRALINVAVGGVQATATMTSTGAATAAEIFTIANVVFTARASGATGNEFNVSATVATQAANIAAAINASTGLTAICTATSALGVVTITSYLPGIIGNGIQFSEGLSNVTITQFTGGTAGDTLAIDCR